jgi:SOS-response transcriptional repressor LexA
MTEKRMSMTQRLAIVRRARAAAKKKGISQIETTRRAGVNDGYLNNMADPTKSVNPKAHHLEGLAKAVDLSLASLLTGTKDVSKKSDRAKLRRAHAGPIPLVARVQAGAFREMPEFRSEFAQEYPVINAGYSEHHPKSHHVAFEIRGDSMNAATPFKLVEGMAALCVEFRSPIDGRIYVVARTEDDGQNWELTLKRLRIFPDRYEFRPESTNPIHKPLIIKKARSIDHLNSKEIKLLYLMYNFCSLQEF